MAMASGVGATLTLAAEPQAGQWPTAALFGERTGRALVAVTPEEEPGVAAAADGAGVQAVRLGTAGGTELAVSLASVQLRWALPELERAWTTPF
jgi:FlaG/FlaF family flagellin (archaellin)